MKMLKSRAVLLIGWAAAFVLPGALAFGGSPRPTWHEARKTVKVMTQNLYPGFSEVDVLSAGSPEELAIAVAAAWEAIQATDFPARAAAMANEIGDKRPDLIGLQEASLYQVMHEDGTVTTLDFIQILLDALASNGTPYRLVGSQDDIDVVLPSATGDFIRLTDRDALLVRKDLCPRDLKIRRFESGNYDARIELPVAGGAASVLILRGWVSADVKVRGQSFRFVSTHLEDLDLDVQAAQVQELLSGAAHEGGPILLVGDFNSDADAGGAAYGALLGAGFEDAWAHLMGGQPGYTCCQEADLLNPVSALSQRLDLVLYRKAFDARDIHLVGEAPEDRTPSGLWPSDHAGVAGSLEKEHPDPD
jgi:endonuclease/exonuclease/phosphatase family metal-dependent hydrolase